MIDAHCHLNASYTADSSAPVLKRFIEKGGKAVVDVTTTLAEIENSQQLILANPLHVYTNVGLHPESPDGTHEKFANLTSEYNKISELLPKMMNVVGIGETGIDYSHFQEYPDTFKKVLEQQRELFVMHLSLATQLSLPITIHARGEHIADFQAYTEILRIIKEENFSLPVFFHSYGGNYSIAKQIADLGYFFGVNGIVTYSGAKAVAEVVEKLPLEFFLLETDSPFLIPSNLDRSMLGSAKVNEPLGIFSTAKRVAVLKKCNEETVLETSYSSTKKLFAKIL